MQCNIILCTNTIFFKKKGFSNKKLKFTEEFYNNMISFPFHIWMSDKEFKYLKAHEKNFIRVKKKKIINFKRLI